jgi:hypothetical protein
MAWPGDSHYINSIENVCNDQKDVLSNYLAEKLVILIFCIQRLSKLTDTQYVMGSEDIGYG